MLAVVFGDSKTAPPVRLHRNSSADQPKADPPSEPLEVMHLDAMVIDPRLGGAISGGLIAAMAQLLPPATLQQAAERTLLPAAIASPAAKAAAQAPPSLPPRQIPDASKAPRSTTLRGGPTTTTAQRQRQQ